MNTIQDQQILPISLQEAWQFFINPNNLLLITPQSIPMNVVGELPNEVIQGSMIQYVVKPILNIPLYWTTIITELKQEEFFIDEQLKGPYKYWHHEHHFKAVEDGVLMTDILHYTIGKSVLGYIAGKLFVDAQVKNLFVHRKKVLAQIFTNT